MPATYPALVYLNGDFLPPGEARVPVFDRGFVFADGIYEVIPVYARRIFRLEGHLVRLRRSLSGIRLDLPLTDAALTGIFQHLITHETAPDQSIYLQVTRGVAPRDHAFPENTQPTVFAYTQPLLPPDPDWLRQGVAAITAPDPRWLHCDIKAIALLPNVLLREQARVAGAVEALLIRGGLVTEGAASNVFVVIDGRLRTPPNGPRLLPGITRDVVVELAHGHGLPCLETDIPETQLHRADEIMVTSSTREILSVTRLDGRPVGDGRPGPVFRRLTALLQDFKLRLRSEDTGIGTGPAP